MEATEVVTSDGRSLGQVVEERDGCVVVETGHVFKSKHAIPGSFLHEVDGKLRATVTKEVVTGSPKVDLSRWDVHEILRHYGVETDFVVDPDPTLENAETVGARHGVEPAPSERAGVLGGESDPAAERPAVFERQANAADPAGLTANLDDKKRATPN